MKTDPRVKTAGAKRHAEWVATLAERSPASASPEPGCWHGLRSTLRVSKLAGSGLQIAEDEHRVVLFCGFLTNAGECTPGAGPSDAAALLLQRFAGTPHDPFSSLRGPFAALAWDRRTDTLVAGRDQIGLEPLFYARAGTRTYWSPSADALVDEPGVSADLDPVALSEWVCGWYADIEDTTYRDVRRVPPATMITVSPGAWKARRYWDAPGTSEPIEWLAEDDLDTFDALLRQAVRRTLTAGRASIFLSGGVDSIAVATTATDLAREAGDADPMALCLAFPDEATNEESIQTGVARQLGIDHAMVPLGVAAGPDGLLAESLALAAGWPQPMFNFWASAYMHLARIAGSRGHGVILTGRGGDEWLTVTPYVLADLVRSGNLTAAWQYIRMRQRSNGLGGARAVAALAWRTAGRPIASSILATTTPGRWRDRRRRALMAVRPAWLAPDPALRAALDARIDRLLMDATPAQGFYVREMQEALRHPAIAHDMEETQELGRRVGLRVLHPFWDVDLISMLYRVPPSLLIRDGRTKWLLRRRIAERLPGLGLEKRGKLYAGHVFKGTLERETPRVAARFGGQFKALASVGVVGVDGIALMSHQRSVSEQWQGAGRFWVLLNLESWARQRQPSWAR